MIDLVYVVICRTLVIQFLVLRDVIISCVYICNDILFVFDGNNSRFIIYSNAKAYTYTNLMAVGFHLPLSLFGFQLFLFIYLQYYNP